MSHHSARLPLFLFFYPCSSAQENKDIQKVIINKIKIIDIEDKFHPLLQKYIPFSVNDTVAINKLQKIIKRHNAQMSQKTGLFNDYCLMVYPSRSKKNHVNLLLRCKMYSGYIYNGGNA